MKNIRNILAKGVFMLLVSLLAMACTEKSDWGIAASYSRPFGTNEDGINVTKDEKVARVTVTWDAMPGVEYYILEISKNELTDEIPMGSEENGNLVYGNTVENRILKAPFLIDNLEAGAEYYLRIKSVANGKESYWAYLDEPFKTVTEEDVLNVPAEEDLPVASGKVRMSWEAGLTVTHFEIVGGAAPIERAITAEEAAAGEAWIEGLKIFTAYTISIYNNETLRGSQEVVVPGLEIESTVDEITANTARFSWDNTVDVDQYICQPSSAPTPDDATGAVSLSVSEVNEHAVIIPNLEPSTEYTVYAFYNGAICARATFTTKKGKPVGYTEYNGVEALIADWDNLSGNILVTISADADLSNKSEIPAAVTNIVFWGEGATQPKLAVKNMQTLGAIDKIEFYNLNISALSNDCVIAPNTEGSSIANIEITSCTIENYRGIVRVRKVNGESSLKLNIDDCIIRNLGTKGTNNYYGIVQTDGAVKSVIINMMNSTFANPGGTSASLLRVDKADNSISVIKNCTFYNLVDKDALVRGAKGSLTVENVLFAGSNTFQIFYDDKTLPASLNWSKVYRTSDLTVSKPGSTSTTALSYSSSQLFPNASSSTDVLDLTFGADIPNEVKIIGDPRWNK